MFKYKVGMYGGSFDPLHIGHIHDIIRAAAMCEELYVMISWCEGRESTSKELRYRWILNSTKHLPNVKIILIEDKAVSKEEYNTDYYWEKGAQDIKDTIGKPLDAVFCGSDYYGTNRFESLYCPESEIVYFDRTEVPISSTDIREWALGNWDYIPDVCKDYYTQKVLIVGGESTGKSTLVQNLALAYNTNFVSEVGRDTCEYAGGEEFMIPRDLHENILRQRLNVMDAAKHSNRILFVDTDALTTMFYSNFLIKDTYTNKFCTALAQAVNDVTEWDLVLFLEPDVEFVQDGTRSEEIASDRIKYSNQIGQLFEKNYIPYRCIGGNYLDRFNKAKEIIKQEIGLDTKW
jgi:HTH-type transcriptional repressor of NAD biosynthesis genes